MTSGKTTAACGDSVVTQSVVAQIILAKAPHTIAFRSLQFRSNAAGACK
jgi:hypothetical protein